MHKKRSIIITIIAMIMAIITIIVVSQYKSIQAFFTDKAKITNKFKIGQIEATVTEPNYKDNQTLKPNEEIIKDPTISNTGKIPAYIRAQIYVPISKEIKYVDENENVITPEQEIEILKYTVNEGWQLVTEDGFYGIYTDKDGNVYKVYTYKYMQNGQEKIINPNEEISTPVFSKVKAINYLDTDTTINLKLQVSAIAVQPEEGKTAEEMWANYKKQNETAIIGIE